MIRDEFEKAYDKWRSSTDSSEVNAKSCAKFGARWMAEKYKQECGEGRHLNYESICELAQDLK